jgi:hypothetical protein
MNGQEKPHLSITQINMLNTCGQQYYFRYILGKKIPPGISLVVGKTVDDSVNKNLQTKIDTETLMPIEQVKDIARDQFEANWYKDGILFTEEEAQDPKKAKGEAADKTIRLSTLHATNMAPIIKPKQVQRRMFIKLEGFPVDLLAYIDIQEEDATRDTKTASKSPQADIADVSDQLTFYAMANYAVDGKIPSQLVLDYLIDNKTPKAISLFSTRTEADFETMLRRIENAVTAIEKGVFIPARQDDWRCSKRFCGYAGICPYFRQRG